MKKPNTPEDKKWQISLRSGVHRGAKPPIQKGRDRIVEREGETILCSEVCENTHIEWAGQKEMINIL